MTDSQITRIDVDALLRERIPKLYRFIPSLIIRRLEALICQKRLNEILEENKGLEGADFARGVLHSLDITVTPHQENLLPDPSNRRVLYVSNHPLGGLDGIALIDYVQRRHGGNVYFVVNDLLAAVKPLEKIWLPVNKHGRQNRHAGKLIENTFNGNDPIIMFPAGLCSRLRNDLSVDSTGLLKVEDMDWHKMFVNKAYSHQRDIIPIFFEGRNSMHFYKMARRRVQLGIKFNFEMVLLPKEMINLEHARLSMTFGSPIPWQTLKAGKDATATAMAIRETVYNLISNKLKSEISNTRK